MIFLCYRFSDFELEKEKSILDEQGLRIAENQENSQKNRRKLAENTRGMNASCFCYSFPIYGTGKDRRKGCNV